MVSSLWLELLTGEKPFKTAPSAVSAQQPQQQSPKPAAAAAAASSPQTPPAQQPTLPSCTSSRRTRGDQQHHLTAVQGFSPKTTKLFDTFPVGTKGQWVLWRVEGWLMRVLKIMKSIILLCWDFNQIFFVFYSMYIYFLLYVVVVSHRMGHYMIQQFYI